MRSNTLLILGFVAAAAILAFFAFQDDDQGDSGEGSTGKGPALSKESGDSAASPARKETDEDKLAIELVSKLSQARAAGNKAEAARLRNEVELKVWDTHAAREWALQEGTRIWRAANKMPASAKRVAGLDKARRLLSRAVWLPRLFDAANRDTKERADLKARLAQINREVMTWGPGIDGVTAPYPVPSGILPVQIVARRGIVQPEPLEMGPNAVMFWNMGTLDARRMRAGSRFVLPLEPLSVQVNMRRFRLAVFIGDWFVKEWMVGHGAEGSPTPMGTFYVHSKQKNPDWWAPGGKLIRAGDPKNELGRAWIALEGPSLPHARGIGIHGTNAPETVGTRCSNGCVRLKDEHVDELYWWVRTGSGGGKPSTIHVFAGE